MAVATLALIGVFVALYLSLWTMGWMGPMVCGSGSCELVQTSRYAKVLGVPVAFYGLAGYLALLAVSLIGLQPRYFGSRGPTTLLLVLGGIGVVFTGYLSYLEAFVIGAWCRWCVVSAVLITAIFFVALAGHRSWNDAPP